MKFLIIVLISLHLATGAYVVRKAPEFGKNVCIMGKEEYNFRLNRKIESSRETIVKDCGILPGPLIDCEEHIIKAVISYVPIIKRKKVSKLACCPGWQGYHPWFGCHNPAPCLSLPVYTPSHCVTKRHQKLAVNRNIYKLNKPPKVPAARPPGLTENLQKFVLFPLVNLTSQQANRLASVDGNEVTWLQIYGHLQTTARTVLRKVTQLHSQGLLDQFNSTTDFDHLQQLVRKLFTKGGKYHEYFRYPSVLEKFKDIIRCDTWQDDQVFVEQRLAALNPMSLQRVTNDEDYFENNKVGLKLSELRKRLDVTYDWDSAVSSVVGRETTLQKTVEEESLFVVHFPYLDSITNAPDIAVNIQQKERKIKKSTSPIALFVSVKLSENKPYELKPVAIQIDSHEDSPVYVPGDGYRWLLAKQLYQVADFAYVEMVEHLLKTHMTLQPICVIAKRTMSEYHPLSEMLKWHCRGLIANNVNGFPKLVRPGGYMHTLFSMGHIGSIELLNKAYLDFTWEDTDFLQNIKRRGVEDQEKLPYFPYRDDGYLIYQQIQSYVKEYISLYYGGDKDVLFDVELQNFANQLSADGNGVSGGMAMMKGFPRRLSTKSSLTETLSRILWLPVQHNAVNYPIAYYGTFVPNMPTRLYDDSRAKTDEYSFYTLPDRYVATVQAVVSSSLGSLRFDQLLDYGAQMVDKDAGDVVKKHHRILMTRIKAIIDERNEKRYKEGHLTYPYLKPGWIPNSIHT